MITLQSSSVHISSVDTVQFSSVVDTDRSVVYRMSEPIDPSRYRRTTQTVGSGILNVQPKVLCDGCNSGWMNAIEQAAVPIVARLIRSDPTTLAPAEQAAIAEWAIAATILRAEIVPGDAGFSSSVARAFRAGGLESVELGVWIARVDRTPQGVISPAATSFVRSGTTDSSGVAALYWLRELCVIVAQDPLMRQFRRQLQIVRVAARDIPSLERIEWPLKASLTDRTLIGILGLEDEMTAEFLDVRGIGPGRHTEQVLRVRSDMPANDLAAQVLAHRLAEAEAGPWHKR
ncbi:MAG: hypothetical protein ACJLS2_09840 [Microcella pacifica]